MPIYKYKWEEFMATKEYNADPTVILGFDQEDQPGLTYHSISSGLNFTLEDTDMLVPEWEITVDFPRWGDIF